MKRLPQQPEHLRWSAASVWIPLNERYEFDPHDLVRLTMLCEEADRVHEARLQVEKEGAYYTDRFGAPKAHPGLEIERKARNAVRLHLRELGLDLAEVREMRPPTIQRAG